MAKYQLKGLGLNQFGGVESCGNLTTFRSRLSTTAAGLAQMSTSLTALAVGDVLRLNLLPAGMVLQDSTVIVSDGLSAGVTGSLGFEYVDGVNDADVPQDAAYFGTGLALDTPARLRNATTKALVRLPKEAYLTLTIAGAASASAGVVDFIVEGERLGA